MKRPTVKTEGFTLIELLIVVVILSTLAAIVVPQFANSSDSARIAATKSSLSGIRSALDTYRNDKGRYPGEAVITLCGGSGLTLGATDYEKQIVYALTLYSSGNVVCDTKTGYPEGPYLRAKVFPGNPAFGNATDIAVDRASATLGLIASGTEAWHYRVSTGEFIANQTANENF